MLMKKRIALLMAFCLLLAGCADSQADEGKEVAASQSSAAAESVVAEDPVQTEEGRTILPLPDSTMENLTDAILSVSLNEGDAYVDDEGRMQMDLKIYSYDQYDMVDIAQLKVGDTLVGYAGEVEVVSKEQNAAGTIYINGGLENGGFDLVTDDCGTFFETGFNDAKSWYEIGTATIRVSADFLGIDSSNPEQGEVILYPGDFLTGAVANYDFTPYNTTVRVEEGQIVEMHRVYVP